ncbi:unnamed protein product [Schistocephalus solidus]|uniref:Uncharacterized protein n=1 Tax=Schistocephalus solidus TaxID=70667 RepID=A0A183TGJ7_SCHSO|nr:unnamed protein product [Schistocephalus solidus]
MFFAMRMDAYRDEQPGIRIAYRTDQPGVLGGPCPESIGLEENSEDRGSNLRSQPDRRRQDQKSGMKVTSTPDQHRQCPGPSKLPALSPHLPRVDQPSRTSSDAMHQQSDNSKFYVHFCQTSFGLPHPHSWHQFH